MNKQQKNIFYFSLIAIVGYWIYDVLKVFQGAPTLPDHTGTLLLRILLVKSIAFLVLFFLLKGQGDGFQSVGWKRDKWARQVLIGFGFGIAAFILINILLSPVLNQFFPRENQGPGIMAHFTDMSNLPLWILTGILGGGFVEELQRTFVLTRFEKWKGTRIIIIILLIDVVSFGIGHLYQGPAGAISTGISGLIFGLVYLRKRSFIEAFTCHAIYDVIGIVIGHLMMQQPQ